MSPAPNFNHGLLERIAKAGAKPPLRPVLAWIEPAPGGGWQNVAGYAPLGYSKDANGRVWLRGVVGGGTVGGVLATLTDGYRPQFDAILPAICAGPDAARVDIKQDGSLIIVSASNRNWVTLDSLTWRAYQ
jgi:hypothetical protein